MKKISRLARPLLLLALCSVPLLAAAQGVNPVPLKGYGTSIIGLINNVFVPVLLAVAFIVFVWGIFEYFILGASNEEDRKKGRQLVLWGLIGFVVIFSLWGLVQIVKQTFNFGDVGNPTPPTFNPAGSNAGAGGATPYNPGYNVGTGCSDPATGISVPC